MYWQVLQQITISRMRQLGTTLINNLWNTNNRSKKNNNLYKPPVNSIPNSVSRKLPSLSFPSVVNPFTLVIVHEKPTCATKSCNNRMIISKWSIRSKCNWWSMRKKECSRVRRPKWSAKSSQCRIEIRTQLFRLGAQSRLKGKDPTQSKSWALKLMTFIIQWCRHNQHWGNLCTTLNLNWICKRNNAGTPV